MGKVFGIGWAKTGTTTLGECLRTLGYRHQSQRLDLVRDVGEGNLEMVTSVAAESESFEDWPWLLLYREFDELFPGSRFILTVRQEDRWLRSYRNMLEGQGEASGEMNEIRRILYGLPFPDVTSDQLLARYRSHNREVMRYFSQMPERLLVVDWEKGHGWREVCGFLGHEVPDTAFPHANRGRYSTAGKLKALIRRFGLLYVRR